MIEDLLKVGDDSTPEVSKVRDSIAFGVITSGSRCNSEEYQKFLSRAREQSLFARLRAHPRSKSSESARENPPDC